MNKPTILIIAGTAVLALALGVLIGLTNATNSDDLQQSASVTNSEMIADASAEPTIWTCSMHPQIQKSEPGDCPICGMDLIPLVNDSGTDLGPRTLSMSESSRALAEIQTSVVRQDYPEAKIRLVGTLGYDETREKALTARFPARIDELFVNFKGIRVAKGDHLARVYSPELLSAQRELLTAHRTDPNGSIVRAVREKLRLWDLAPEQIDAIIESGEAKDSFVLKAPIGGVVVTKNVKEGDYLKTGETLFKIVELSNLWATLNAYESDLPWLRYGQDVDFTVEAMPGETFHGQIVFIEPELDRMTRTVPIRVNVPNFEYKLKPGMFVRAIVDSRIAKDGKVYAPEFAGKWISPMHPEVVKDGPGSCDVCGMDLVPAEELGYVDNAIAAAPLIIPTSAVLRTGKRAVVYVEKSDAERPTYQGREIVLGPRAGDFFLVVEGLEAGERVVTNGAFKIDSALQIQAQPSMMNSSESEQDADQTTESVADVITVSVDQLQKLLPGYLELHASLAADDLARAKGALSGLMSITGHTGDLPDLIHTMLAAESLDEVRKPHFEKLSNALIATLKDQPQAIPGKLYIMHCPMVYGDHGADWLQDSDQLLNPYFGAMMLKCGELTEELLPD